MHIFEKMKQALKKAGILIIILLAIYLLKGSITGLIVFDADYADGGNSGSELADKNDAILPEVVKEDIPEPDIYFCPRYNCSEVMVELIENAENSIHCALYDLDLVEMISAFDEQSKEGKDVKIVVDKDNYAMIEKVYGTSLSFVKFDNDNQLMHNKFCVFDGKKITSGSFNPTLNDNNKNNNNLVVIESSYLSQNYDNEFSELWNGWFGKGNKDKQKNVKNQVIESSSGLRIENYFCPEDDCEEHVLETLDSANDSIRFMVFSFTSDAIGEKLVEKYNKGITVEGVLEKKQNTADYSEYWTLAEAGIDVAYDTNPYNLHHKVFIVDDSVVITGSYNPTASGDNKNDENILIIHSKDVASRFIEEFEVLV